jgi:Uma2 family endonuclease
MAADPRLLTPGEYLTLERQGERKHEYVAGEQFAMVGASFRHNLIQTNIVATLYGQLGNRPCTVLPSDMRVKIEPLGIYTYPDVTVVCGEPRLEDDEQDTLLNPTVIIEILSPSTERYDRGRKFQRYRLIPAFREYVLVAQESYTIDHYIRQPDDTWNLSIADHLDSAITLPSIGCTLALADVYRRITLDETVT